jgi:hypothetical protein
LLTRQHPLQYSRITPHLTPLSTAAIKTRFLNSIAEVSSDDWNRLANEASPFLKHEFLLALEESGCTTPATGWQPCHLIAFTNEDSETERLVAALPLYRKTNSYGEYVFDWSWADAYQRNGLEYYPKLLTAIPFTPSVAPRFLLGSEGPESAVERTRIIKSLIETVTGYARDTGISSWHILFPNKAQSDELLSNGLMRRTACQFHWHNRDYQSFDDFLQTFSSRKRKNLRKERDAVKQQGISFESLTVAEITESIWDKFYLFYQSTYHVRGQTGYLSRDFFSRIARSMPENILLVMAKQNESYIAGALSFKDKKNLYGRYWGCMQDFQFLHFETCYYQGIEFCIENKLQGFDSGAQGEHKIQRGFEPIKTYSNHWIADKRFADAIADFSLREASHIETYINEAKNLLPFKKDE